MDRKAKPFWRIPINLIPLKIVSVYLVVSALYIAFSDRTVAAMFNDAELLTQVQTIKGMVFIGVTAALIYFLIRRYLVRALRSQGELASIVASIADGVLVVDSNFKVIDVNQALIDLVDLHDLIGHQLKVGEELSAIMKAIKLKYTDGRDVPFESYASFRALKGETVKGYDAVITTAGGRDIHVGISSAPVYVGSGPMPSMAVTVFRDITELRRLESLRDEFLSTAAHELKTPVTVIKAYAQLLEGKGAKNNTGEVPVLSESKVAMGLEAINRQCDRLSRLIQELLEGSRLQRPYVEMRRDDFDLGDLVADVVAQINERSGKHRVTVEKQGAMPVQGDRERIERVMVNLVDNAIKFSPGGGEIHVTLEKHGEEVHVSVADHGVGIPLQKQGRITERYYRAHAGTRHDFGGMGVGLSISREIIERHGGKFWFHSEEGKGSTFYFSLQTTKAEGGA